jgi:hypothetical protein
MNTNKAISNRLHQADAATVLAENIITKAQHQLGNGRHLGRLGDKYDGVVGTDMDEDVIKRFFIDEADLGIMNLLKAQAAITDAIDGLFRARDFLNGGRATAVEGLDLVTE